VTDDGDVELIAIRLEDRLHRLLGEIQSGLVKEEAFDQLVTDIDTLCATLKERPSVPKALVHRMLSSAHCLHAEAPMHGAKAELVTAMARQLDRLTEVMLTGRTLAELPKGPRVS
jgi:hypothetical protein